MATLSNRPGLGIACVIGAVACFAVLDTTVKYVSATVPLLVAVWFRYLFQALVVSLSMLPAQRRHLVRTAHHDIPGVARCVCC